MSQVINETKQSTTDHIQQVNEQLTGIIQQWQTVIVGQSEVCEKVLIALIAIVIGIYLVKKSTSSKKILSQKNI